MLSKCKLKLEPRKSQNDILDVVFNTRKDEKKLYVVSPPGSGKTITGLMVAVQINVPTVVLVPNTAIQSQWIDKTRFFLPDDEDLEIASIDPEHGMPITVMTYQALAQPQDMTEEVEKQILAEWKSELVEEGESDEEADEWLANFAKNNPERFQASLMQRFKKIRKNQGINELQNIVNDKSRQLMEYLKNHGVKLVIFDECHHLSGYWAQVAYLLVQILGADRVLGLTATPPDPDDLDPAEYEMHKELLHEIDFKLSTPAVVKDGHLVPYQDLVYFTRPEADELEYVRNCSKSLESVLLMVEEHSGTKLSQWLQEELNSIPEKSFAFILERERDKILLTVD